MVITKVGDKVIPIERLEEIIELPIYPSKDSTFVANDELLRVPRGRFGLRKKVPDFLRSPLHKNVKMCKVKVNSRMTQVYDSVAQRYRVDRELLVFDPADVIAFVCSYSAPPQNYLRDGMAKTFFPLMTVHYEPMVGIVTMDSNGRMSIAFEYVYLNEYVWQGVDGHCFVAPFR